MLTAERLRDLMSYDPETGIFRWKVRGKGRRFNDPVGFSNFSGYLRVSIDERRFLMQRLAWLYVTGEWPSAEIDHINSDRADNRWANLRPATAAQNRANMRMRASNRARVKGVRYRPDMAKWEARICKNYRQIYVGAFKTAEEAHAAYYAKARELFGEFARAA